MRRSKTGAAFGEFSDGVGSVPKPHWNQWFPAFSGIQNPPDLAAKPAIFGPRTWLNLPHPDTSGNRHGESIMIDLAHA
jgi:hypothetical protein